MFVCGRCLTGTGALLLDGMIATTVIEGSMTRERYLEFVEGSVVRVCASVLSFHY